ncbi:hypothetical protein L2Y96_02865 [Luteibacter aegosomaticola]|uniref:hypothetical protein n=1 Tax=Luteibacter aegosomaticola TaxID=2911538 RepID=UPI001FF98299|nr:hypothetical protein [Luteibacter aegosomaticola]UPG90731.1 hypothetical protein L2Y96_02865 [Luteibacter aegosomaticola]
MSHGMLTKRRTSAVLCALMVAMGTAHAAVPDGQWKGVVRSEGDVIRVQLIRKGEKAHLQFSEPGSCSIPAELLDEHAEVSDFRFGPSPNGGAFCVGMYPGDIRIESKDVDVDVSFERAGRAWSGTLKPAPVAQRRP